jgi:hypothetical protein
MSLIYLKKGNTEKVQEISLLLDDARAEMLRNPPNQAPPRWQPKNLFKSME